MSQRAATKLLDTDKLTALRLQRGLSQRALAARLGVSAPVIARLEQGRGHGELPLWRAQRLADELATTLADLLDIPENPAKPGPDDTTVEALLASSPLYQRTDEIAIALGWTLPRTTKALNHLRRNLRQTGIRLHRSSNGWTLAPRRELLPIHCALDRGRARIERRGLRLNEATLLWRIATGRLEAAWEQHASTRERKTVGGLLRDGLIVRQGRRYMLAPGVLGAALSEIHPR